MSQQQFFKVDIHTHILPAKLPDLTKKYGYPGWISIQQDEGGKTAKMTLDNKPFRDIQCNCYLPSERLLDCEQSGVNVQVLSTVPVMFNYWAQPEHTADLARYLNDNLAATVSVNPKRFIGLGTLPMQSPPLAIIELERCKKELGFVGAQIGSHINEWNLDAPELDPVWNACEELDMALFIHPWDMEQGGRMTKYWFPWLIGMPCETTIAICSLLFGGVLERHPKLKVCFAHGGGSFPFTMGRIEHGYQVRPDLCATQCRKSPLTFIDRIWTDSLVHDNDALDFLIKRLTVDRIMLGTDYPFPLGELSPGKVIENHPSLSKEDKAKLLGGNVMRFFGLKQQDFHQPSEFKSIRNGAVVTKSNDDKPNNKIPKKEDHLTQKIENIKIV